MEIPINKRTVLTTLGVILCGWLFLGIYSESGSGKLSIFLKYRPSFRVCFYSLYDSESKWESLSDSEKRAAEAYHEIISGSDGYMRSVAVEHLVFPLITGSLMVGFFLLLRWARE